jgi:anti-sigma factor RsiW
VNCPRALKLLQPYLDRALSEPVAENLRTHLDACEACGREYATFRSLDRALADEPTIDSPSTLARAIARRAAARHLTAKRILLPAWLEAVTLGGTTVALGAGGFIGVSLLSAAFDLHLSPSMTAAGVAAVIATGLAAFTSSFYGAEI